MKVVRLIDEYGLNSIGEELEQRWTTDGNGRTSLRALVDHFDQQLLAAVVADAGMQPLSVEVERTPVSMQTPISPRFRHATTGSDLRSLRSTRSSQMRSMLV